MTFLMISLSIGALIAESMQPDPAMQLTINVVETTLVVVFSAEYLLHLWVAENRLKYATSFWGIVDLLAILPALLAFLPNAGFRSHNRNLCGANLCDVRPHWCPERRHQLHGAVAPAGSCMDNAPGPV